MLWVLGGILLAGAGPAAAAGYYMQGIPGATCSTDRRTTGSWEYQRQKLVNTDSDPWGIAVATCPVSVFSPGNQPREYRISLTDPERRSAWCRVYSYDGTLVRTHYTEEGSTAQIIGTVTSALGSSSGHVEMTLHCLLLNGASLDRVEILWWRP
jgi:hypothetical protein